MANTAGGESSTASVFNTTESGNVSNTTECWNEYCWDEDQYFENLHNYIFPQPFEWGFVVLYALTFVVGLVGNFLVMYAVWRNHNMRTVTNIFIVNLAIGDFLVIFLCLPATIIQDVSLTWFLGTALCKVLLFLQNLSVYVSVLTLSAIAVERWYAICHPLAFKSTLSRAQNIIVIIWVVSAGVALPELIVAETSGYNFPEKITTVLLTICGPTWAHWKQVVYNVFLVVAMYISPLVLMATTYTQIAIVLWKNEIPGQIETAGKKPMIEGKGRSPEDKLQSRRKAAKMLITIVVLFAICYLPVHILNILRYLRLLHLKGDATAIQSLISHWLPYFNSSFNPVIYNFMSAKFRKEFKLACFCCLRHCYKTQPRRRDGTFTMTFSNSNYSNCHTEEVSLTSFRD